MRAEALSDETDIPVHTCVYTREDDPVVGTGGSYKEVNRQVELNTFKEGR